MKKITTQRLNLFASEPFRFFFPFALIFGGLGVLKWPLMFWQAEASYPGQSHAFLMVEGFFGGSIMGFALTAIPRMLDSKRNHKVLLLTMAVVYVLMCFILNQGSVEMGNILFILLMFLFSIQLLLHYKHRQCLPPPGFILIAPAIVCAISGAVMSMV